MSTRLNEERRASERTVAAMSCGRLCALLVGRDDPLGVRHAVLLRIGLALAEVRYVDLLAGLLGAKVSVGEQGAETTDARGCACSRSRPRVAA